MGRREAHAHNAFLCSQKHCEVQHDNIRKSERRLARNLNDFFTAGKMSHEERPNLGLQIFDNLLYMGGQFDCHLIQNSFTQAHVY